MNMLKIVAVPMHPEGRKFVATFAAISVAAGLLFEPLFWIGLGLTVWCYYFFRDPVRSVVKSGRVVYELWRVTGHDVWMGAGVAVILAGVGATIWGALQFIKDARLDRKPDPVESRL